MDIKVIGHRHRKKLPELKDLRKDKGKVKDKVISSLIYHLSVNLNMADSEEYLVTLMHINQL